MTDDLISRAKAALAQRLCPDCGDERCGWEKYDELERAAALVPELVAEVERLHSWDGLISLVDEHYPADIFPTEPDRDTRDPGPRIISLLRVCDELRSARPMHPVYDDLAAERLDGIRDERDELLVRVDELTEELAVFRRQQPDDDAAKVRRVQ